MSLCTYVYPQAIIKTGAAIVVDMVLAVAQCTSCKTAGITTTLRRNTAHAIMVATTITTTMMIIVVEAAGTTVAEMIAAAGEIMIVATKAADMVVTKAIMVTAMAEAGTKA